MAGSLTPDKEIQSLIDLVSNTTEAYTAALFLAPAEGEPMSLYAYQSLSRNIDLGVRIGPGEGLIGWVYKNGKPVNIDQFDQDTRRLLIYRTDESIKSFMAVPLPEVHGVLAVDSKQRYVFTDKSQKILHQFGQTIVQVLSRLDQAGLGMRRAGVLAFLGEFEQILGRGLLSAQDWDQAMALLRVYSGSEACFLTSVFPGDPGRYFITAHDAGWDLSLKNEALSIEKGLAGWVMREKKPLILEKARLGTEKSYVFYPEEPLKDFSAFAGLPAVWGGRLRGGLFFVGPEPLNLDEIKSQGLRMAANRLASRLEIEFLGRRIAELGRLDPQVGLPHRAYFTERLDRMLKMASLARGGLILMLMKIRDLDELARQAGQDAAQEVLKTTTRRLLALAGPEAELGHLSYGLFAVTLDGQSEAELSKIVKDLAGELADLPLESVEGRARLELQTAQVKYPVQGRRAEDLIYLGLSGLEQS